MTRSMADSVTARDIPVGKFDLVAGYVDGLYKWSDADWALHASSQHVRITVLGTVDGADVADVENGDLTPDEAAAWAARVIYAGRTPALYFSRSAFGAVNAAMVAAGINPSQWTVWAADWTGSPHILPGTYATQWADPAYGSGGHFDVSLVTDYWPGIDPTPQPPAPTPAPTPPPPVPPPLPPAPEPTPTPGPPIDQTRSAWASLAAFFTQDLPAFVQEILRLLGLARNTP